MGRIQPEIRKIELHFGSLYPTFGAARWRMDLIIERESPGTAGLPNETPRLCHICANVPAFVEPRCRKERIIGAGTAVLTWRPVPAIFPRWTSPVQIWSPAPFFPFEPQTLGDIRATGLSDEIPGVCQICAKTCLGDVGAKTEAVPPQPCSATWGLFLSSANPKL